MMAPFTPFTTEEIYQNYFRKYEKNKSIHISDWPKEDIWRLREADYGGVIWINIKDLLSKIRQEKTKAKKPMNAECSITLDKKYIRILEGMIEDLKNVTNAKEIKEGKFGVEFVK